MSVQDQKQIDDLLKFWFGRVETTVVPSENRARIWFSEDADVDLEIKEQFSDQLQLAAEAKYASWNQTPRGRLAQIILLDQFSRHVHRSKAAAYSQDSLALDICIHGMADEQDHELSLIERVFFYFPLLHSESLTYQERSVQSYHMLAELAFSETRVIYDSFLKFANHHYSIIQHYGRFPQRNVILDRKSTELELSYLDQLEG